MTSTRTTANSTTKEDNGRSANSSPTSVQEQAAAAQRAITIAAEQAAKIERSSTTTSPTPTQLLDSRYGLHVPEDKVQAYVQTPYGKGLVIRTRKDSTSTTGRVVSRDIELLEFSGSRTNEQDDKSDYKYRMRSFRQGRGLPMLHSPVNFPSVPPQTGDDVTCLYGRGSVVHIREETTSASATRMVTIQLSDWRLAHRSRVTCTLPEPQVQVVRPKALYERNVWERVESAQNYKRDASRLFANKEYQQALQTYAKAVDAVRYVQHKTDSDNYVRADLLVVMITCCNNAATCAAALSEWDMVAKYANNALVLLDALQEKAYNNNGTSSRIFKILVQEGYTELKLFGEWKCKSFLLLAKAALQHDDDPTKAMECIKTARAIIATFVTKTEHDTSTRACWKVLHGNDKELQRLAIQCKERKKALLAKEKQRAQAMFGGGTSPSKKKNKEQSGNVSPRSVSPSSSAEEKKEDKQPTSAKSSSTTYNPPSSPLLKKKVTFEDGKTPGDHDDDDDQDDIAVPWYEEHQELLILTAGLIAGIGITTFVWNAAMGGSRWRRS